MQTRFGRIRDIAGLPELILQEAGPEALERIFQGQDVPIDLLETPDALISVLDIIGLYKRAGDITGARSIGLCASEGLELTAHGQIGSYVAQGDSLLQGLQRFKFALPFHEMGSRLDWSVSGDEGTISYRNLYQSTTAWHHVGNFTLRIIEEVISTFAGRSWRPLRIEACYSDPRQISELEDHFQVPVIPNPAHIAIVIDRSLLMSRSGEGVNAQHSIVTRADLTDYGQELPKDFCQIVEIVIKQRMDGRIPGVDEVAAVLNLGSRSVQRRLGEYGTNYRDLLLRLRMRRAIELLSERNISLIQISEQLGYAALPQFMRAFKSFYECTPGAYRARLRA